MFLVHRWSGQVSFLQAEVCPQTKFLLRESVFAKSLAGKERQMLRESLFEAFVSDWKKNRPVAGLFSTALMFLAYLTGIKLGFW
jgi:uncharacterized membrane protein YbaN (DUF454 family)